MGLNPLSSANNSVVLKCPIRQPSFYYLEHVFLFIFRVKMVRKMPFLLHLQLKLLIILTGSGRRGYTSTESIYDNPHESLEHTNI